MGRRSICLFQKEFIASVSVGEIIPYNRESLFPGIHGRATQYVTALYVVVVVVVTIVRGSMTDPHYT